MSTTRSHSWSSIANIYFSAHDDIYGRELFAYDGITQPIRLTDISPGNASSIGASNDADMTWYNDHIYFAGSQTGTGFF